jgi:hypothetical protein
MTNFAVLIPSRGRGALLQKTFRKMPFLSQRHVVIGIEVDEEKDYLWLSHEKCHTIQYNNPTGSVGVARDKLRGFALERFPEAKWFVLTDDNASFTEQSLLNLVKAANDWQFVHGRTTFMAGMHSTAPHFDRHAIAKGKETLNGLTSYPTVSAIYHAVPRKWYRTYEYPKRCFALEDRHMFMCGIKAGMRFGDFRVCMDAPFSKSRYQQGGQGSIEERMFKCGWSIEQLAHDHPEFVGARGTFPTPWQFILDMASGHTADRLIGGAMRKGAHIVTAPVDKPKLTARKINRRSV